MIFMGHFLYATNQEEIEEINRRHGEFDMIVEAENLETAVKRFHERLVDYRNNSDFFSGECIIYLVQLLEFDRFPSKSAIMINLKSMAGDPLMPFIECSVPSNDSDACRIFDWTHSNPKIDGENEKIFLRFSARTEPAAIPD